MTQLHQRRFEELTTQLETLQGTKRSRYDSTGRQYEDILYEALIEWSVKARSLLSKACGPESEHYKSFTDHERPSLGTNHGTLMRLKAVFAAAREDFEGGYLHSTRSLVQAEVFDSELEQARELFDAGFLSAAAVVSGVVLETTLRELCDRHGIPHSKLDKMNADLAKRGVYNKLVQKRITTLADIRNSAAHGKPEEFSAADVNSMIDEVSRFVAEHLTT